MFNYFRVPYRGTEADTSISPIFHLKNVSKREPAIMYLYPRRTSIVPLADKNPVRFLNLMGTKRTAQRGFLLFPSIFSMPTAQNLMETIENLLIQMC